MDSDRRVVGRGTRHHIPLIVGTVLINKCSSFFMIFFLNPQPF